MSVPPALTPVLMSELVTAEDLAAAGLTVDLLDLDVSYFATLAEVCWSALRPDASGPEHRLASCISRIKLVHNKPGLAPIALGTGWSYHPKGMPYSTAQEPGCFTWVPQSIKVATRVGVELRRPDLPECQIVVKPDGEVSLYHESTTSWEVADNLALALKLGALVKELRDDAT